MFSLTVFSRIMQENTGHMFCPNTGKYGSEKTRILVAYFKQCQQNIVQTLSSNKYITGFVRTLISKAKFYDDLLIINLFCMVHLESL